MRWPQLRILKLLIVFFTVMSSVGVMGFCSPATDESTASAPVLLELFTSEGCSSCPPADAFLRRMDNSQPVPGAHFIVLSEHVDYWDHEGWKDPYSSHAFTERQADYVRALHLDTAYTPQIIVKGRSVLRGDPQQVQQTLIQAASNATVPVEITTMATEPGSPITVRLHVQAVGTSLSRPAEIFLASAWDHAESDILRGENGGKHLAYVSVAQEIKKVGKLEKGKNFDQDIELKLKPGAEVGNLRIVAFVQEAGHGSVLGAAMRRGKD